MIRFHESGSVSTTEPKPSTPAAVISTSIPPNSLTARSTSARTCAGSVTSTPMPNARPPCAPISAATATALPATMSATATAAPSAANRIATARPMPEPPPVTMATLPAILPCDVIPLLCLPSCGPRSLLRLVEPEVLDPERHAERRSAVDDHVLAGHVRGVVGGEEQHHLGDVLGRPVAADGYPLEVLRSGDGIVDQRRRKAGGDDPGVDGVDPDAVASEVERGVADEHHDGALGRAVRDVQLLGEERVRGCEHHDRAAAALGHLAADLAGREEDAGKVHVDDPPPQLLGELQERPQLHDRRRVHQGVDRTEPLDHPRDRRLDVGRAGDVAGDRLDGE